MPIAVHELFVSTNEREGSDIARQVILPLASAGVKVVVVTHLVDLAESLYEKRLGYVLFLRVPRQSQAQQFRLLEGAPKPTAYAEDVYKQISGSSPPTFWAPHRALRPRLKATISTRCSRGLLTLLRN